VIGRDGATLDQFAWMFGVSPEVAESWGPPHTWEGEDRLWRQAWLAGMPLPERSWLTDARILAAHPSSWRSFLLHPRQAWRTWRLLFAIIRWQREHPAEAGDDQ